MAKVSYERVGAAAVLTIERPERRNAVDPETADELLEGYRSFEADDDARVLVLTGAGDEAFCAGADLKSMSAAGEDPEIAERMAARAPRRPAGLHPADGRRSRRSPRSRAGAWPAASSSRSGATCGSAPRAPSSASPSAAGACR